VAKEQIGKVATNLTAADIKFSTLGLGFLHHINDNIKVIFYYDFVKNETTQLTGYKEDLKDNIFTTRIHFRF
jgi:phosphate-selective porin